jgi:CheY-like chemotaxis protein
MKETEKVLKKKLLIVEDNQDSRELVIKILRNRDYQLIEAVDGEDGLDCRTAGYYSFGYLSSENGRL